LDGENWGELIGKDLKSIRKERTHVTPEQQVRDDLIHDQQVSAQNLREQEAYAQQFIENARQDGYEVTLDADYRIIDVKKIKKPRYPSLFNRGDSGFGTGASQ
jgi:hypothetical protein